ncbi:MAG TPA: EamA family transporter [Sediminispirochaeta sp.]|nr:EamA family transporter [Sediminispirochaeta sp.]
MDQSQYDSGDLKGRLFVITAAILWGTSGTAQALAPEGASPLVVGTMRILISGVLLTSLDLLRRKKLDIHRFLHPIFLLTGLCQALFQVSYFSGIAYTGVAVGTMVAIGSAPVFTGFLGVFFDRERLKKRWFIATGVALIGLFLLTIGEAETSQVDLLGIALALLAGFAYAMFTLLASKLVRRMNVETVIGTSFVVGTVYLLPLLFLYPTNWIFQGTGPAVVLYLGLISAALAYRFYGQGLKTVPVSTVGTLTMAEPLTASLLGVFFLRENLLATGLLGMVLIFGAQLMLVLEGRKKLKDRR